MTGDMLAEAGIQRAQVAGVTPLEGMLVEAAPRDTWASGLAGSLRAADGLSAQQHRAVCRSP
jgi:hypothetical protein